MFGYVDMSDTFRIKSLYTAFEHKYNGNYIFIGERHNFWELVIVTEGRIGVTANNDAFILEKGQAIIHEPMEFHRLWSETNSSPSIIVFTFGAENVPKYVSKIFKIEDISFVKNILSQVRAAYQTDDINIVGLNDGAYSECQIALKNLEIFLLETISNQTLIDTMKKSRSTRNYTTIVNFLENNVDKNLSVKEIAKMCGMSEINLKQTFSKYAGMGVKNYFNRLKINTAIPLIQSGMTIQEVSDSLGFSSQNYFTTVFKRITGHIPSYYR